MFNTVTDWGGAQALTDRVRWTDWTQTE